MTGNQQKQLKERAERLALVVNRISTDAVKWGLEDVSELEGSKAFLEVFAQRLGDNDYSTRENEKPRGDKPKLDAVGDDNDDTPKPGGKAKK